MWAGAMMLIKRAGGGASVRQSLTPTPAAMAAQVESDVTHAAAVAAASSAVAAQNNGTHDAVARHRGSASVRQHPQQHLQQQQQQPQQWQHWLRKYSSNSNGSSNSAAVDANGGSGTTAELHTAANEAVLEVLESGQQKLDPSLHAAAAAAVARVLEEEQLLHQQHQQQCYPPTVSGSSSLSSCPSVELREQSELDNSRSGQPCSPIAEELNRDLKRSSNINSNSGSSTRASCFPAAIAVEKCGVTTTVTASTADNSIDTNSNVIEAPAGAAEQHSGAALVDATDPVAAAPTATAATAAVVTEAPAATASTDSLQSVSADVAQLAAQLQGMLSIVESLDSRLKALAPAQH
jgi:hypothetical protein